jgi:predicted amidohydrolase
MEGGSMIQVAAVQMEPRYGEVSANLQRASDLVRSAQADLFVLPELFSTGYLFGSREETASHAEGYPDGPTVQAMIQLSRETGSIIVGGFPECSPEGSLYNACALIERGQPLACYRKIHLFDQEKDWFDAGCRPPEVVPTSRGLLGPLICFDWIFPETIRCLALEGAQIIVHPANLVLSHCQGAMVTRCLENRLFAVTANRVGSEKRGDTELTFTGRSQITGCRGDRLAQASPDGEEVIAAPIDPAETEDKWVTTRNHLFQDRRPGLYRRLLP